MTSSAGPAPASHIPAPGASAQSPSVDRGRRSLQLDVLRGVAILLVIGRHIDLERPSGVVGALASTWFRIGWLGVDLFFVLSGFLIGGLLLSELDRHGSLNVPRFLVRRGLKLYPPYFIFIFVLMFAPALKVLVRGGDALTRLGEQFEVYWPNLLFLHTYVGQSPAGHTWSLAVEEHFYLLLPFALVALTVTGRIRWLIPAAVAAVPICLALRIMAVWTDDRYAFGMSATHLRLDALLFGVAIRAAAQYHPERFLAARRYRIPLLLLGIALWAPNLVIEPETAVVRTIGLSGTFLGSAAFFLAAFHTRSSDFRAAAPVVKRLARGLGAIGVYSYAIYLWHVSVIGLTEQRIGATIASLTDSWTAVSWLVTVTGVTSAAIAFGVLVTKVIDWPVLRLRDRFFPSRAESIPR